MSTKNIYRESRLGAPKDERFYPENCLALGQSKNGTLAVSKWDTRPASEPKALPCKPGKAAGKALGLA
jgi:hypothetical protein